MKNLFRNINQNLEKSHWFIAIYLLTAYALYIGVNLWIEDYNANLFAYQVIPTLKTDPIVIPLMARFLQIAPILFGVLFLRDMKEVKYGYLSLMFLVFDWFAGVYYRTNGFNMETPWIAYAVFEDFIMFTVGSEVLVTLAGGILISTFPTFVEATIVFLATTIYGLKNSFSGGMDHIRAIAKTAKHGNQRPPNIHVNPTNPHDPTKMGASDREIQERLARLNRERMQNKNR